MKNKIRCEGNSDAYRIISMNDENELLFFSFRIQFQHPKFLFRDNISRVLALSLLQGDKILCLYVLRT